MVTKLLYTLLVLLAMPFVYGALTVVFLVSLLMDGIKSIVKVWQ